MSKTSGPEGLENTAENKTILETHVFFKKERGFANGIVGYIGDGYCNDENNNAGCHFDGSDSC